MTIVHEYLQRLDDGREPKLDQRMSIKLPFESSRVEFRELMKRSKRDTLRRHGRSVTSAAQMTTTGRVLRRSLSWHVDEMLDDAEPEDDAKWPLASIVPKAMNRLGVRGFVYEALHTDLAYTSLCVVPR